MKAAAIRTLTLDAVAAANSGHSGMPMGMADVATVLFEKHLNFDPKAPNWPDRDRFILSAGHGSMLLYSLMYLTGSTRLRTSASGAQRPQATQNTATHAVLRQPQARSAKVSPTRLVSQSQKKSSEPATARTLSTTTHT
jgi:transketolase